MSGWDKWFVDMWSDFQLASVLILEEPPGALGEHHDPGEFRLKATISMYPTGANLCLHSQSNRPRVLGKQGRAWMQRANVGTL